MTKHPLLLASLLLLVSAPASAKPTAVKTACVPLDAQDEKEVAQICASLGTSPQLDIVSRKNVWTTAAEHGLDKKLVTGRYRSYNDKGPVRSTLKALDVEALVVVKPMSNAEARVVTFGYDGSRGVMELESGKLTAKEWRQIGGFTVIKSTRRLEEFRKQGGWDAVVTERELADLDPDEQLALKLKQTSRCYVYDKTWFFCQPDRIGASGFVFGRKGKPFTFVKAGGSFVGGVHLGKFDEAGFERKGERQVTRKDFDPFVGAGAPAFLVKPSGPRAALACGETTEFLDPLSFEESRKLLADVTIRFAPATRNVRLKKTKDGKYIWVETIRHASGAQEHRVFIGKPPVLKELTIKDRAMYLDGGTTVYEFDSGGGLFLPANMWFMDPGAHDPDRKPEQQTLPDGSKMPKGGQLGGDGFKWPQYVERKSAKPQKLYFVDDAEKKRVLASVKTPLPVANAPAKTAVCGVVMPKARK